jgi:hypothetical protein
MDMIRCPHCGETIGEDETVCPFCHKPLDEESEEDEEEEDE